MSDERAKLHYMRFYVADFMASTAHWSDEEVGSYIRLLCHEWTTGSVPADPRRRHRISDSLTRSWPTVSEKFRVRADGELVNDRLQSERERAIIDAATARHRARKAAAARWGNDPPPPPEPEPDPEPEAWPEERQEVRLPAGADAADPVVAIPTSDGGLYPVLPDLVAELAAEHPGADVEALLELLADRMIASNGAAPRPTLAAAPQWIRAQIEEAMNP